MVKINWTQVNLMVITLCCWMENARGFPRKENSKNKKNNTMNKDWKLVRQQTPEKKEARTHPQLLPCPKAGFFRHPEDCRRFYRCVDFGGKGDSYLRYQFDCAPGTVFDERISVCNHPYAAPPCDDDDSGSAQGKPTDKPVDGNTTSDGNAEDRTESSNLSSEGTIESSTAGSNESTSTLSPAEDGIHADQGLKGTTESTTPCQCPGHGDGQDTTEGNALAATNSPDCNHNHETEGKTSAAPIVDEHIDGENGESSPNPIESESGGPTEENGNSPTDEDSQAGGNENGVTEQSETGEESGDKNPDESATEPNENQESTTETDTEEESKGDNESPASSGTEPTPIGSEESEYFLFQILCGNKPGYRRHPLYCDRYYKCTSNGDDITFELHNCSDGEIYSNGAEACVQPNQAPPCKAPKSSSSINKRKRVNKHKLNKRELFVEDFHGSSPRFYVGKLNVCPNETYLSSFEECSKHYACKYKSVLQKHLRILYNCPSGFLLLDVPENCSNETVQNCGNSFKQTVSGLKQQNDFYELH